MARTLRTRPTHQLVRSVHSASVQLEASVFEGVEASDDSPKWVQVTREGDFPGYQGGQRPFKFTRKDLNDMVANIRVHPAYQLDANGNPIGHVIPWDFNHASEQNPTSGNLPVEGAPAQGWTLDLEVRSNAATGHAELWALTQFLEPARTYVRMKQYKWASVAAALNAVHPESGQKIGAMVTSIALTNTPFIEGMELLVASKTAPKPGQPADVNLRRTFYESARTIEDGISYMRELFGLPETAGISDVMHHIGIVQGWFASGAAPLGTDPSYIVGSLRVILNLPTLTPDVEVLGEAAKSIQVLVQQQAAAAGVVTPPPADSGMVPPPAAAPQQLSKGNRNMSETLLKVICSAFGVREAEDAAISAAKELVELRNGLREIFKLERDSNAVLLGAAKETATAKERLISLFTALGIEKPDEAVAKVAQVMESSAKLKEVMPELEALRVEKKKVEEAAIETEVDQAIAASKLPASVRPALLLFRRTDEKGFKETYKVTASAAPVNAPKNQNLTPAHIISLTSKVTEAAQLHASETINLSAYAGANPTARAKAYLASTVSNWDKLSNEDQWQRAVALRRQPNVIDQAEQVSAAE